MLSGKLSSGKTTRGLSNSAQLDTVNRLVSHSFSQLFSPIPSISEQLAYILKPKKLRE
jgi:hypothetical protein